MCNPRRIRVRATRQLAEAWEQEVRRQVTRVGEAAAEARVREPLESSVGRPTLAALTAVLGRTDGWEQDADGVFRHELTGGHIAFDPSTRELEIVARASAVVRSVGEAATVVRAEVSGTVEAEGVGTYYDDEWGGITEADARRAAEQDLERSLSEAAQARRDQARREADEEADDDLRREANRRADEAFAAASAARASELRRRAADSLAAVGIEGRNLFHQALAEAYRDAILAYARAQRAENIQCAERGGVLEIEFEMQV
jgi:FtsH ternary system domain X2